MATKMSLKLLIHRRQKKVLLAEAGKDFIDYLFSLLALPLGSVISLMKEHKMVGCIENLYESLDNLTETYVQSSHNRDFLLYHPSGVPTLNAPLLLQNRASKRSVTYYTCKKKTFDDYDCIGVCSHSEVYLSAVSGSSCPRSGRIMNQMCSVVAKDSTPSTETFEVGGFVKGVVTYTVRDDLVVSPMSAISNITLLNKFGVTDLAVLEERNVDVGVEEALAMLKASLQSETVLTDVFMGRETCSVGNLSDI